MRLLRVLSLAGTSLPAGELALRAGLGRTGVYPALAALEATGIIEYAGTGTQRQLRFREQHPLAGAIEALFRPEAGRIDSLTDELRALFGSLKAKAVSSAWLDGTALTEAVPKQPHPKAGFLTCYLVGNPATLPEAVEEARSRLPKIERRFEVNIDIEALAPSEIAIRLDPASFRNPVLLAGVPPLALLEKSATKSARALRNRIVHSHHDDSGRRLARAIALGLKRDPSRRLRATEYIRKRMRTASKQEQHELAEWLRILSQTPLMIQRFLEDPGPRATRLRQSLPAIGLLSPRERDAVLKARSDDELEAIVNRFVG